MITRKEFDQWIEDLESGKYPQTKGQLRRTKACNYKQDGEELTAGYCCLGVFVAGQRDYKWDDKYEEYYVIPRGTIPFRLAYDALLDNEDVPSDTQQCLTLLNDGYNLGGQINDALPHVIHPKSHQEIAAFLRHKGYKWITTHHDPQDPDTYTDLPEGFVL